MFERFNFIFLGGFVNNGFGFMVLFGWDIWSSFEVSENILLEVWKCFFLLKKVWGEEGRGGGVIRIRGKVNIFLVFYLLYLFFFIIFSVLIVEEVLIF